MSRYNAIILLCVVIARSEATRQSRLPNVELDCRASLAMTIDIQHKPSIFYTLNRNFPARHRDNAGACHFDEADLAHQFDEAVNLG
jgi:hypothetical protein